MEHPKNSFQHGNSHLRTYSGRTVFLKLPCLGHCMPKAHFLFSQWVKWGKMHLGVGVARGSGEQDLAPCGAVERWGYCRALGMLLLPARGLEVSGSSCAAANNEENNKTFREMFS